MIRLIKEGKINIKMIIIIGLASVLLTVFITLLFGKSMFVHHGVKTISDWSECDSTGYAISGNHIISTDGDPCIYFTCDEKVEQVEIDVEMISNMEMHWNKEMFGEDFINCELFWSNENGELTAENSAQFKATPRRDSYLIDVDCPANTLYRVDIGDGADVEFKAYSISFNTYNEYNRNEKIKSVLCMEILVYFVLLTGYIGIVRFKEEKINVEGIS